MARAISGLAACLLLGGFAQAPSSGAAVPLPDVGSTRFQVSVHMPDHSVVVPIVGENAGGPVIAATLNGTPVRLQFDTGANELLQGPAVGLAKLRPTGRATTPDIDGLVSLGVSTATELEIGEARFKGLPFAIATRKFAVLGSADGFIGRDLVRALAVTLDAQAKRMTLSSPASYRPPPGAIVAPLSIVDNSLVTSASIDGHAGLFEIDTGSDSELMLFPDFAAASGLDRAYAGRWKPFDTYGLRGEVTQTHRAVARELRIGDLALSAPAVTFLADRRGFGDGTQVSGLIGMPLLARYEVTFDLPKRVIVFAPRAQDAAAGDPTRLPPQGEVR